MSVCVCVGQASAQWMDRHDAQHFTAVDLELLITRNNDVKEKKCENIQQIALIRKIKIIKSIYLV